MTTENENRKDPTREEKPARSGKTPSTLRLHLVLAWESWLKTVWFDTIYSANHSL